MNLRRLLPLACSAGILLLGACGAREAARDTRQAVKKAVTSPQEAKKVVLRTQLQQFRIYLDAYQAQNGRWPERLDQLVAEGFAQILPVEPFGGAWIYNGENGTVQSSIFPDVR